MDDLRFKSWYLIKPEAISRFLVSVIRNWGYPVFWNRSEDSESVYLKLCLGTPESPRVLHIRISNHSVPQRNLWVMFNMDVYCGHEREGATNYIKLISKLADILDRPIPEGLERVITGTEPYKSYRIEMQRRRNPANGKPCLLIGDRLYV
jgi:hypothetical protein